MVIRLKWMVALPKKVHKVIGLPVLVKAQGKSLLPGLWAEEEEGGRGAAFANEMQEVETVVAR